MLDSLDNIKNYGSFSVIIISFIAIFLSGLFFAGTYYIMDVTEDVFESTECTISNNVFVGDCQELWELSVYPFFALKELLIWISFFFIFALVIGMLIVGYQSGKSPVLLGVLIIFIIVLTYLGIEISNVYRTMLDLELFRDMMIPFTVYNRIMLGFPWFIFFVGILSLMLSIVNYQKTSVNNPSQSLNY